jgi:uncharacterized membrane protein
MPDRQSFHQDAFPAFTALSVHKFPMFLALLLVASACTGQNAPGGEQPAFDEASINNVWHQAKLRGVAFRAIGQEPGWLLEITNGEEILLITDYGQNRNSYPYVEPIVYQEERRTQYVLENYGVTVEIRGERCTDVMSGEEFEVSVSIIMTDRRLEGCGRALF